LNCCLKLSPKNKSWYNKNMKRLYFSARARLGLALGAASLLSTGLYLTGAWGIHQQDYAYMIWNLFLAWVPLVITLLLERTLHRKLWSSWPALGLTALWLVFLPNTFYMVTDYIHVRELSQSNLLSGLTMFTSFIFLGVILGFLCTYIVHIELKKRIRERSAYLLITLVLFLCSFAMYMGRELRWNTWDIVTQPFALLFDITDRLMHPLQHSAMYTVTLGFFVFLIGLYLVLWNMARAIRQQPDA